MDKIELSNLAFLLRSISNNPSMDVINAARKTMDLDSSPEFRSAFMVISTAVSKACELPMGERKAALLARALELRENPSMMYRGIGGSLEWALTAQHTRSTAPKATQGEKS